MDKIITIRQQVYNIIKRRIAEGVFKHGQRLQEVDISTELGVSRSPVREAFKQLEAEGLLIGLPNKGVFVRSFTEKEIADIYDVRMLYERYAIDVLAADPNDNIINELNVILEKTKKLYDEKNYLMEREVNFHYALVENTKNSFVISSHRFASTITMSYHDILFANEQYVKNLDAHIEIISLLLQGDYKKAEVCLSDHLMESKEIICAGIQKQGQPGDMAS